MKKTLEIFILANLCLISFYSMHSNAQTEKPITPNDKIIGRTFKVIGELYYHEVILNLNEGKVELITLVPLQLSGPEIFSRNQVPVGSTIKIVSERPKKWFNFFAAKQYWVNVDSIKPPEGVPIRLGLDRGNEGIDSPLNPSIYQPL